MTQRPIDAMLHAASERRSGHMPGHKGHAPFGPCDLYALDTTEIPVTDDLYCPESGIAEAQRLYAEAAGAGATLFLHNGSTVGIHVMLQLWAREGDTVLLPRNAHLSAANACAIGGLRAVWIPVTQEADGFCHVREEAVLDALQEHPEAKALLLTRPDYYGAAMPIRRIVARAHAMGIRVVVDEAHGAHYPWLDTIPSAGAEGADAWVQSVHKTLPGLTASAVLHLRDQAERHQALRLLRREQTSSPSFILLRSIDDSRAYMDSCGCERLRLLAEKVAALRERLPQYGYADAYALWRHTGMSFDPTRLVIEAPQGGRALAQALADQGIDAELADHRRVVLILSVMTEDDDLNAIEKALASIPAVPARIPALPALPALPEKSLEIRAAAYAPCEPVPFAEATGRVAAQSAGLYPPGVPLVVPGERIPTHVIRLLEAAEPRQRFGTEGDCLLCVKL